MFENSGDKIKGFAKFTFAVGLIASFVCSIAFGRDRWGHFNLLSFLLILLGGAAGSYISALFLHAVGDIVDHLGSISYHVSQISEKLPLTALSAPVASSSSDTPAPAPVLKTSPPTPFFKDVAAVSIPSMFGSSAYPLAEDGWNCPKCGTFNSPSSQKCSECGKARL